MRIPRNKLEMPSPHSYDGPMTAHAEQLKKALGDSGHRLTGPRLAVWETITGSTSHMTADEIAVEVRAVDPTVNLSSVYRSLALFSELGLVRESNLGAGDATHWELAHPDEQFHLRCTSCGRVEHHTGDLVARIDDHLSREHGFTSQRIELLVLGLCEACAARS